MNIGTYDFTIRRGDSVGKTFTFSDTDLDLTEYTVRMQIRKRVDSDSSEIIWDSETSTNGYINVESADVMILYIPREDTASFNLATMVYDIEFTKGSDTFTLFTGIVTLDNDVTREEVL